MKRDFSNVSFSTGVHSPLAAEEGRCVPQREKTFLPQVRGNKKGFSGGMCRTSRKAGNSAGTFAYFSCRRKVSARTAGGQE